MPVHDLRYALNTLRRSPGYVLMCVAVLALGIGANAAIFSVLDGVILRALPYRDAGRLVFVWERFPAMPPPVGPRMRVARKNYEEWKRQSSVFADMAAFRGRQLDETGREHPRKLWAGFASVNLFPMLGVGPRLGRLFAPGEERAASDRVMVLTDAYFESRFHRDPGAVGKTVSLDGTAYTVIGVLPAGFHLPSTYEGSDQLKPEVWVPLSRLWNKPEDDTARELFVAARLKPGVTLARARAEMDGIAKRLAAADPKLNEGWLTSVFPFTTEDTDPKVHRAVYVLMAAVAFLLLIACANLANLTLARATGRSREIAVRLALGATRGRIVSQLVAESFVVAAAGAGVGLVLADWCVKLMLALKPEDIQRPEMIGIDFRVFVFTAMAAAATTLLFGLAPALAASRQDLNSALKSGGGWGASAARPRSRQFLIAVETALALMLVVGAGLMIRSFQALLAVGLGFQTDRVTIADVELPEARYKDDASQSRFFRQLLDAAGAAPEIRAAAVVDAMPLHSIRMGNFYIAGRPEPPLSELPMADMAKASPAFFQLIGLRLEAGRWLTDADLGKPVALVNRAFARQFFAGGNPLGQHLLDSDKKVSSEIVGIVSDYRSMGVENGTRATIFWPELGMQNGTLVVRSAASPTALTELIRKTVWSVDKDLPAVSVAPMQHWVDLWLSQRRFNTLLLEIFAGLALVLAAMGIYGVLANLVASRVREIGIRMAIGATPGEIGRLVLRQAMVPVAAGTAAGLAGSLALGRFLQALLFGVKAGDPFTRCVAAVAILAMAPAAIYVPLRRATGVDCTVALREE
jgi:putative ABC transport system permease protein